MTPNNRRVCLSLAALAAGSLPLGCPAVTKMWQWPLVRLSSARGLQVCCLGQAAVPGKCWAHHSSWGWMCVLTRTGPKPDQDGIFFPTDWQILEILCECRQGLRDMTLDWLGNRWTQELLDLIELYLKYLNSYKLPLAGKLHFTKEQLRILGWQGKGWSSALQDCMRGKKEPQEMEGSSKLLTAKTLPSARVWPYQYTGIRLKWKLKNL